MLMADNKRMQQRIKAMQETINNVTQKNVELLSEKETFGWNSSSKRLIFLTVFIHATIWRFCGELFITLY